MFCLTGASALSDFRRERLLAGLRAGEGATRSVVALEAVHRYYLDAEAASLDAGARERLGTLLDACWPGDPPPGRRSGCGDRPDGSRRRRSGPPRRRDGRAGCSRGAVRRASARYTLSLVLEGDRHPARLRPRTGAAGRAGRALPAVPRRGRRRRHERRRHAATARTARRDRARRAPAAGRLSSRRPTVRRPSRVAPSPPCCTIA